MEPDEIQSAIDRAANKRRELQRPPGLCGEVGADSLDSVESGRHVYKEDRGGAVRRPEAAALARVILQDLMGTITLKPGELKGESWACYKLNPAALVKGSYRTRDSWSG